MLRKGEIPLKVGPQLQCSRTVQTSGVNLQNIPRIIWGCPTQFLVDPSWGVKAGLESREKHTQLLRESRIAEIIYLTDSDIPANPSVSPDAHDFHGDDSSVPLIPLNHIDEEPLPGDVSGIPLLPIDEKPSSNDHGSIPLIPLNAVEEETARQPLPVPSFLPPVTERPEVGIQALLHRDEVIGSAVALVALIKSKEPGSHIDLELLIQLLRNPGMLDKLMKEHGLSSDSYAASSSQSSITASAPAQRQITSFDPSPIPWSSMGFKPTRSELELGPLTFAPLSVPGPKMVTEKLSSVHVGVDTWSPSIPFAHSRSQEVNNIIAQIGRDSESQSTKSMSMSLMSSLPNSSNDVGKMRKLINEYGNPIGVQSLKPGNASSPSASSSTGASKGPDYYRNLILQHGSLQENVSPHGSEKPMGVVNSGETRPQKARPCVYFNSPQGCRHGPNCWFQHIKVNSEEPSAKRMKPSGKGKNSYLKSQFHC